MYHVSTQGVDECMINVYYYHHLTESSSSVFFVIYSCLCSSLELVVVERGKMQDGHEDVDCV